MNLGILIRDFGFLVPKVLRLLPYIVKVTPERVVRTKLNIYIMNICILKKLYGTMANKKCFSSTW